MSNEFHGTGHVREEPIVKVIAVGENRYTFATLQVFFPDGSPPADGSDERAGGFSLEVNVWGGAPRGDGQAPRQEGHAPAGERPPRRSQMERARNRQRAARGVRRGGQALPAHTG